MCKYDVSGPLYKSTENTTVRVENMKKIFPRNMSVCSFSYTSISLNVILGHMTVPKKSFQGPIS